MLSKKMAFSLMSLITLLAFAFAFVADDAFAAEKPFEIKIVGRTTATYAAVADDTQTTDVDEDEVTVDLIIESAQPIGDLSIITDATGTPVDASATPPILASVKVIAIDRNGFVITPTEAIEVTDIPRVNSDGNVADGDSYSMRTAKKRQLRIVITQQADADDATKGAIARVVIEIPVIATTDPTVLGTVGDDTLLDMSKLVQHTITLSMAAVTTDVPKVVSIQRLRPGSQTVVAAFQEVRIEPEPFNVRIVLTAPPHGIDLADVNNFIEVENGTVSGLVTGVPFARFGGETDDTVVPAKTIIPNPIEGMYEHDGENALALVPPGVVGSGNVPSANSVDDMYRQYRVTITPHQKSADFDVKVRIKSFHDNGAVLRYTYLPPVFADSAHLPNGRNILTIPVLGTARNLEAGYRVIIPKDWIIPAGGYLIVAQNKAGSEIDTSGQDADRTDDTPRATFRTPAQLLYNVIEMASLPNLATSFLNGVVVDVESQHPGLVISEVMWGEDVSLDPSSNSQYIELYNPGGQYKTIDDLDETPDINEALTLIFYAPNEYGDIPQSDTLVAAGDRFPLPAGITDRIGTLGFDGVYWSPTSKGQSGRSGTTATGTAAERGEFVPVVDIVSMYRAMVPSIAVGAAVGAMMVEDGQVAANWTTSAGPKSANFDPLAIGVRHGTPGAATDATTTPADTAAEAKAKADAAAAALKKTESTGTMPEDGQIYISEIMFAGGGILPQWIEISNGSRTEEINLSGWTLMVDNAAADADVSIGATATFTISDGTTIDASGQQKTPSTILVVTEAGRNNVEDSGQVLDLMKSNEVDLILAGVVTRKYTLLSGMAFMVTLSPPEPEATKPPADETVGAKATRQAAEKKAAAKRKAATDRVGNLGADGAAAWALPMSEDGRSSIIRRHVQVAIGAAAPDDGTLMDSWVLASETSFAAPTHIRAQSYYGAANDVGTPGFRAGGALPVELSHFRPARDKVTGAVVITWSTQSELNNAGFFIKRSQQRDGEFQVINATMIQGAGTSSEKQFYTYNDSTAQPNVVYYYQIEDVSLDGNRQTLTNGIRLKGHVSVAGKLTTLWGDLKTSQ